jgi:hypothetical protein
LSFAGFLAKSRKMLILFAFSRKIGLSEISFFTTDFAPGASGGDFKVFFF